MWWLVMERPKPRKGRCAIAVMAKAPRPGLVKTRLVPPLSPKAAAALSASFLRDITENIALAACAADLHGYVAYAPAGLEAAFDGIVASGTRFVVADGAGVSIPGVYGFGRSLLHAAQALFAHGHAETDLRPCASSYASASGRVASEARCWLGT
jgi:uncharacterized protein